MCLHTQVGVVPVVIEEGDKSKEVQASGKKETYEIKNTRTAAACTCFDNMRVVATPNDFSHLHNSKKHVWRNLLFGCTTKSSHTSLPRIDTTHFPQLLILGPKNWQALVSTRLGLDDVISRNRELSYVLLIRNEFCCTMSGHR